MPEEQSPVEYCAQELRRQDHERYLCCLLLPARERAAAFALYAFYHEVAKTAEIVSEPLLGGIRLQWWRESVEGIYAATPRSHPVVLGLRAAIEAYGLKQARLMDLIDAREPEVEGRFPQTEQGFVEHVERTAGPLFTLLLEIAGEDRPALGDTAAIAYGVPGVLRRAGHHASLPGYDEAKRLPAEQCQALAQRATAALEEARAQRPALGKSARRALLPLALAEKHLQRLEKAGFDYRAPSFIAPRSNPVLSLLGKALSNRF